MVKVNVSPEARNDLREIKKYIAKELYSPKAADNTISKIMKRIRELSDFPEIGSRLESVTDIQSDYRFLVCGNYTAFYRYDKKAVYVDRVMYGRRDFMKILFSDSSDSKEE